MDTVVLASDPAPLPAKLIVACLAGLLLAILSGCCRTSSEVLVVSYLIACVAAVTALHWVVFVDPGVIAAFVGLSVGFVVFVLAPSKRSSVVAATTISLTALMILGITAILRMPPSEMRRAIAHIRHCGGIVQQSDNPGITYHDQWSVRFDHAGINDTQLSELASDLGTLPQLWLTLSNCPISDQGLAGVARTDNLVWLEIDGTQVTDAGLTHIAKLSCLARLDLHGTKVSDNGLRSLLHLSGLESLRLDETAVTEIGAQELRKALPKCTITLSDHGKQGSAVSPSAGDESALSTSHQEPPSD